VTFQVDEVAHVVASTGLWVITVWRCRRSLRSRGPDRSVWFTIFFLALAGTVDLWPVHQAIDSAAGHPAAGATTTHVFVVLAGLSVIDMWRRVEGKSVARRHCVGAGIAVATVAAPLGSRPAEDAIASANEFYDPSLPAALHWSAYLAFMAWTFCLSIRAAVRYRRMSSRGSRRVGVTLIASGCAGGLAYVGWKAAVVISTWNGAGAAFVRWDSTVDTVVVGPSLLLVASGASFEALSARLDAVRTQSQAWNMLRRVSPLWRELVRVVPHVVLEPPRVLWAEPWSPRHVHLRLHRRVIEIRDAMLTVSAHAPTGLHARAGVLAIEADVPSTRRAAVTEAAWLAAACELYAEGAAIADPRAWPREAGASLIDEARWLIEVAEAGHAARAVADRLLDEHRRQEVRA